MKKTLFFIFVLAVLTAGCTDTLTTENADLGDVEASEKTDLQNAVLIAESSDCLENSTLLIETASYNENSKTWWIDMTLEKEGCSPACVISLENKTAEINYRCTGLIVPEVEPEETPSEDPEVLETIKEEEPAEEILSDFENKNPVSKFTKSDIDALGISCSGTDSEIAECIRKWQADSMIYCPESKNQYIDCTDPIRWNYFLPGIFSSRDIILEKTDNGKIYGICFDYSVVYCSIADYYGLACRVVNTLSKPSEGNASYDLPTTGLSEDEYKRLEGKLSKNNLKYDYEAVRLTASETPSHFWAEVKLDGNWKVMDATQSEMGLSETNTQTLYIEKDDFEVTDWESFDKTAQLDELQARIDSGEDIGRVNTGDDSDFETFTQGQTIAAEDGTSDEYIGITDALGNENRAANIDDFMRGLALAPYVETCEEACDFVLAPDFCYSDCDEIEDMADCYKTCSGEEFYMICDNVCEDENTDQGWVECYMACSGQMLDLSCDEDCWDD